jgi:hypothetical protein
LATSGPTFRAGIVAATMANCHRSRGDSFKPQDFMPFVEKRNASPRGSHAGPASRIWQKGRLMATVANLKAKLVMDVGAFDAAANQCRRKSPVHVRKNRSRAKECSQAIGKTASPRLPRVCSVSVPLTPAFVLWPGVEGA